MDKMTEIKTTPAQAVKAYEFAESVIMRRTTGYCEWEVIARYACALARCAVTVYWKTHDEDSFIAWRDRDVRPDIFPHRAEALVYTPIDYDLDDEDEASDFEEKSNAFLTELDAL
jgi:hypothetical protein